MSIEDYLGASGRSGEELEEQLRSRALGAVKADLALRAVAEAEAIEASDEEIDAEIHRLAHQVGEKPAVLRRRLEQADQLQAIRSDAQKALALAWLNDHAEIVDEEGRPVDRADLEPPADETDTDHHQVEIAEERSA
jgi:trigger factor